MIAVLMSACLCAQASFPVFAAEAQPAAQEEAAADESVTAEDRAESAETVIEEEEDGRAEADLPGTDDGQAAEYGQEGGKAPEGSGEEDPDGEDAGTEDVSAGETPADGPEAEGEDGAADSAEDKSLPDTEEYAEGSAEEAAGREAAVIEESAEENAVSEEAKDAAQTGRCGSSAYWELKEENGEPVLYISGSGSMYDYDAPKFAELGDGAVRICIDDGITRIGKNAFCGMDSVEQVVFGRKLETIGARAFMECGNLAYVSIQKDSALRKIGAEAFRECASLEYADFNRALEEIDKFAFYGCPCLETVKLGPSVRKIGQKAFYGCQALREMNIPASIAEMGADAVSRGEQTEITYAGTKHDWQEKFGNALPTVYKPGFYRDKNGKTHYGQADGSDVREQVYCINGKYYAFDRNGCTVCSQWYITKDGDTYYTGKNGAAVTGFRTIGGKRYYFTDSHCSGFKEENTGVMRKYWGTIDGNRYYFAGDGVMRTGFRTIGNKKYYFLDKNCSAYDASKAGVMMTGWRVVDGKKYYFGSDGVMKTGWQTISGKRYHLTAAGIMDTGWKTIGGKKYHFTGSGVMETGWRTISKKKYYFGTDGVMRTEWQTVSGKKYYFGSDGVTRTGWQAIGRKWYLFASSGVMNTGWYTDGSGKTYYLHNDGHKQGAGRVRINGKMCAFTKNGVCTSKNSSINDVVRFAKSWVGKIPYKSSVTGNDPHNERSMELKEGRGSDCSWFVFHCLEKYGYLTKFVHSYEWGSSPSRYPNGKSIGKDITKAKPGDIICYDLRSSSGAKRTGKNSHVAIYIGNGKHVECASGYGTTIDNVMKKKIIDIVRFED